MNKKIRIEFLWSRRKYQSPKVKDVLKQVLITQKRSSEFRNLRLKAYSSPGKKSKNFQEADIFLESIWCEVESLSEMVREISHLEFALKGILFNSGLSRVMSLYINHGEPFYFAVHLDEELKKLKRKKKVRK